MARLLVLLVSLAILSAASGTRLLQQTLGPDSNITDAGTAGLVNTTTDASPTSPTAGNAPSTSPAGGTTGNTTATGPFAAAIAAAGVPYNVSIITEGLDRALAAGALAGIPGISAGQVNITILMPVDEAWQQFFAAGFNGTSAQDQAVTLEDFLGGSFVSGAAILYHAIPAKLLSTDLTNITRIISRFPPGVQGAENISAVSDNDGAVVVQNANVLAGIPALLLHDTLDVAYDLATGNITFEGTYNSTNAQLVAQNSTTTDPATAVEAVDQFFAGIPPPNEALVLFPDIPGPAGTVIHVIDKVLLPGSEEALQAYAQAFEVYLASLNATSASPAPAGSVTPGVLASPPLAPVGEAPVSEAPAGEASVGEAPTGEAPTAEAPVGEGAVGLAPVGEAVVGQAPVAEAPVG